jgi:hypothetical protein
MIWRLWALVASAPLGVLAAFAWPHEVGAPALALAAAAGGLAGAALAALAVRRGDDAPDRTLHVMRGASAGLVALPALGAAAARFGPPAWLWLALAAALPLLALWRASRASGPAPGPFGVAAAALGALAGGGLAVVVIGAGFGLLAPGSPAPEPGLRAAAWDIDSRVALAAPQRCAPRAAAVAPIAERGAAPRLDADGSVWLEARAADGRFQVHRIDRDGALRCWTCAEPGNNRRPAPHPSGRTLLFDSDRFASWRRPNDSELMLASARGEDGPRHPSRRLTYAPGPDDHALHDPSGSGVVWARGGGGRFEVVRASIQSGHGGLLLSTPLVLFSGRSAWVAPLAWAPDARTLVAGFGQPLAPLAGQRYDPATGQRLWLAGGLFAGSVSFSADGSVMALAATQGSGAARLVPAALGNLLARWPARDGVAAEGTRVLLGDTRGELDEVALGEVAGWGAPTGIALLPDARGFVLGQRGPRGERILRVELDCDDAR